MTSLPHEKQRKEVKEMNTLVIVLIAAVCLFGAYTLYGRWLANKWGIDPTAKTPAVVHEDGRDYVPTNGWTVFAHQFSSIAGAGPVTGAIQAAAFGWLPVLLWVLLGGIFVLDLLALLFFLSDIYALGTKPRLIFIFNISALLLTAAALCGPAATPATVALAAVPSAVLLPFMFVRIHRAIALPLYLLLLASAVISAVLQ